MTMYVSYGPTDLTKMGQKRDKNNGAFVQVVVFAGWDFFEIKYNIP